MGTFSLALITAAPNRVKQVQEFVQENGVGLNPNHKKSILKETNSRINSFAKTSQNQAARLGFKLNVKQLLNQAGAELKASEYVQTAGKNAQDMVNGMITDNEDKLTNFVSNQSLIQNNAGQIKQVQQFLNTGLGGILTRVSNGVKGQINGAFSNKALTNSLNNIVGQGVKILKKQVKSNNVNINAKLSDLAVDRIKESSKDLQKSIQNKVGEKIVDSFVKKNGKTNRRNNGKKNVDYESDDYYQYHGY